MPDHGAERSHGPSLLAIGTATPAGQISQAHALLEAQRLYPHMNGQRRLLPALYRRTSIRSRASVLIPAPDAPAAQDFFQPAPLPATRGPGTGPRMDRYALAAPALARQAADAAIKESNIAESAITHLVTISCTGFAAPGVDSALIHTLGLSPQTQRTHIGFMGCHGAINGLRVAKAFVDSDPAAAVLLCAVELCSLHFHYGCQPDQLVANALFADGAAAAVLARSACGPLVAGTASCLIPGSADAMTWAVGDHGFEMTLSARVPELIQGNLRPWLEGWLAGHGLTISHIGSWAIHPGGPRVIGTVLDALGLPQAAGEASRAVLADHGNMSSPTVLFILKRLLKAGQPLPAVGLAFGPGLVVEAVLVV
jgi:predicted naringenin-chalcone synthase